MFYKDACDIKHIEQPPQQIYISELQNTTQHVLLAYKWYTLSSRLLSKHEKTETQRSAFVSWCFMSVSYLAFHAKKRRKTEGVWEQGTEESIWTYEKGSNRRME